MLKSFAVTLFLVFSFIQESSFDCSVGYCFVGVICLGITGTAL